MDQNQQPVFNIEKLYVKDLSVEVPNAPQIYLEREAPKVEIQLNTQGTGIGEGVFEVVLTVTVTANLGDKTVFLVEVRQAGIFRIQNVPNEQMEPIIAIACPNILYPYAREAVSDAVTRAGFNSIVLQPVNFEAMYMARLQQQQAQQGAAQAAPVQ
ncbi:MAG: protein-export chaperone SecB [Betaproteobacteria bacterium]|jgi:preprotein translocase subunit SecB|nr:protein-export chaperone SecB [Betaproteobacteria bacterium]HMV21981.1 protein-export chaperone SecB [Rhodocyclaceae bacterium]HMW77309.1 protein-export chaperone SecB [Rhodocyclaceae bacterium]HNE42356.1 protein-export chaperone SecB [Rhodocyclaceae bacterium]HNL21319.1 protein-export chaperone SecB [Rhodocyclaceae bacterium]